MLKQQQGFFRSVLMAIDTVVISGAVALAYAARFHWIAGVYPPREEVFSYATHAIPVLAAVPLLMLSMMGCGLYRPRRDQRFFREAGAIIRAVLVGLAVTIAFLSLFRNILFEGRSYSGAQFIACAFLVTGMLLAWRFSFRTTVRWMRRQGWNLRHVAIIGTGRLGQVVFRTLSRNTWTGIAPSYFISHHGRTSRTRCQGLPVHGGLADLEQTLDAQEVSGVFIAMPGRLAAQLPELLLRLERYPVDVRVVPDMNPRYMPINMTVHDLDGMPVLSVRQSPLSGWGRIGKRTLDLAGATVALGIFALPMLAIALLVRLSGPGPVVFRQERMSLNGQRFRIFKFRTMRHVEAERPPIEAGSARTEGWTRRDDPRITRIGRFLRRTSLDELPQLLNVLIGEMSLVGPRPERPELIERFRDDWRGYMLRQHVKAGMTGWAQVNGLRGDTSLRKRLQYDLFYIRNWSFMFDLRILWMTLFRGFAHPNAH